MASNKMKIGAIISLDGEKEYRQAIANINKAQAVLRSEMKLCQTEFEGNANSLEALQKKQDILNRQYEEQEKRVATLRGALQDAEEQYGSNSKQVQDWQIKLNNAQVELVRLDKEVQANQSLLYEAQTSFSGTARSIDEYGKAVQRSEQSLETVPHATEQMSRSIDDMEDSLEDGEDSALSFSDVLKANLASEMLVGGLKVIAGQTKEIVTGMFEFGTEGQKAMNSFAVKTGTAREEMDKFDDTMKSVYSNNFGDSMEDIADTMSVIKQNLQGISAKNLQEVSEYAILMRDSFGYETQEQIRAVKMLMEQFGISAEEAYTLIAQGAQQGLDKNGDLLDTINEYSVHFKDLGYSAEDMFDMLISGSESGTFSVDKLGDAVKEMGIRIKSAEADQAFQNIGLSASEMREEFAKGGDAAVNAGKKIIRALESVESPTDQFNAGVALMGTMFEDLHMEGVAALLDVGDHVDMTADTLKQMNSIRYDDLESNIEQLGRKIETRFADKFTGSLKEANRSVLDLTDSVSDGELGESIDELAEGMGMLAEKTIEVGADALPVIVDGFNWLLDNGEVISGAVAMGTATWVAYKIATEKAAIQQSLLNAVMNANPIGLVAAAVGGLVGGLAVYIGTAKETNEELDAMLAQTEEFNRETEDLIANNQKNREERDKSRTALEGEAGAAEYLSQRLFDLADKEEKSNGEKHVMKELVAQLNEQVEGLNLSYDEQNDLLNMNQESVQKYIDAQKELAYVEAIKEDLTASTKELYEAEKRSAEIGQQVRDIKEQIAQKEAELKKAVDENEETLKNGNALTDEQITKTSVLGAELDDLKESLSATQESQRSMNDEIGAAQARVDETSGYLEKYTEKQDEVAKSVEETTSRLVTYRDQTYQVSQATAENFEQIKAKYEEVYQSAYDSVEGQIGLFDKFETEQTLSSEEILANLQSQIEGMSNWYTGIQELTGKVSEGLLNELREMGPASYPYLEAIKGMNEEQINQLNTLYGEKITWTDSIAGYMADMQTNMSGTLGQMAQETDQFAAAVTEDGQNTDMSTGVASDMNETKEVFKAGKQEITGMSQEVKEAVNQSGIDFDMASGAASDMEESERIVDEKTKSMKEKAEQASDKITESGNAADMNAGLREDMLYSYTTVQDSVNKMIGAAGTLPGAMSSVGSNGGSSLTNSFRTAVSNGLGAVADAANGLVARVKSLFGIHSPSRVFREIGVNLGEGLKLGAVKSIGDARDSMETEYEKIKRVSEDALEDIPSLSIKDVGLPFYRSSFSNPGQSQIPYQKIVALLTQIAEKDPNTYLDGTLISKRTSEYMAISRKRR